MATDTKTETPRPARFPALRRIDEKINRTLDKPFRLSENKSNYRREIIAGTTTFLAMAYILAVNPGILSFAISGAGFDAPDPGAVFTATALASALGCLVMGLWARYPIATAPGMGLNAFFAFTVVIGLGIPWQTALTGTLISGVLFFALAVTGVREWIINAIPAQLKLAVGAGIGMFIAFIGLKGGGIVVANPDTFVSIGDFTSGTVLLTAFGLIATAVFMVLGWKGGVFYGMLATLALGLITGVIKWDLAEVTSPNFSSFGAAFTGFEDAFTVHMIAVILTMLFVDFFDTAGTLFAVAGQAGLVKKDGKLPRAGRALATDSIATAAGAVLGTSTTTAYIESSAGVSVGGRTGLTAVTTGFWFLVSFIAFPVFAVVANNPAVTAPALVIVGVLMAKALGGIDWEKLEYAIPAFLIVAIMPLTYSISNGIAMGLTVYPIVMAAKGRWKEVHPVAWVLMLASIGYFLFLTE
jgi:AGZA family xanthine/uracil permease-like MFS transporter